MQTVRVRLRKPTRVFTFLSRDIPLNRDDACVVKSDRGLEYGTCVVEPEPCPPGAEERYKMNVLRKVNTTDASNYRQLLLDEQKARTVCVEKIAKRSLPMKLIDVEYTFDKHKVVFYFTAADRVDFRELVRDLARELKARIELRHIQVRDEAKLVGGLGVCGRELCCSTWLREFRPVSMKMAKRQNLSLNPSKISGQCGRLLCCLGYEHELYEERKKLAAVIPTPAETREELGPVPAGAVAGATDLKAEAEMPPYLWAQAQHLDGEEEVEEGAAFRLDDDETVRQSAVLDITSKDETGEIEEDAATTDKPSGPSSPRSVGKPGEESPQDGKRPPRRRSRRRRRRRKRPRGPTPPGQGAASDSS